MPFSVRDGAMALARTVMDDALASERGIVLAIPDSESNGDKDASYKAALRWCNRIYAARTAMRKIQHRMASPADLLSGVNASAVDPDVVRTAYDGLFCEVVRNATNDGWDLMVKKADRSLLPTIRQL